MSDIIHLLPEHIANQIAAGEVIQRPASVVKELLENSIDAGGKNIEVHIKDAGKTLIQVLDDGTGMSPKDSMLSIKRHATSKIKSVDDLFSLQTKGFRGEALASISAIAHLVLKTKREIDDLGVKMTIEGGEVVSNEEYIGIKGTCIDVKNLFFNVPARRNFLKSDSVEFKHIQEEFERVALTHPDLHFVLSHNSKNIYDLQPSNLRKRVVGILGASSNDKLVPIEESTDIISINGFVLKPESARKTRGEQYFFVNNRFFKDSYFHHSVNKAFEGLLSPKHIPGYFLYFTIDPSKIDVNVHPTKTEIKFEEGRSIYSILLSSIRQSLGKYNIAPLLDFDQETAFEIPHDLKNQPVVEPHIKVDPEYNPFKTSSSRGSSSKDFTPAMKSQGFGTAMPTQDDWDAFYSNNPEQPQDQQLDLDVFDDEGFKNSFILNNRYMIFPCNEGIMMLDLKRAKQRVVYDDLMKMFISSPINSQEVLFPYEKKLSSNEITAWTENRSLIERLGFRFEINNETLVINSTPDYIFDEIIYDCIDFMTEQLAYKDIDKGEIAHFLVMSISKSSSVFINEISKKQAEVIFLNWKESEERNYAPSGKKIINILQTEEISKLI